MPRQIRTARSASAVRVVRYWSLFDSGDRQLMCELCRTAESLELRCGTDIVYPMRIARVESAGLALALAEQWRMEYLDDAAGYHQSPRDDGCQGRTLAEEKAHRKGRRSASL